MNPSTTYLNYKSWINWAFITYKIHFYLPMRKALNVFSSIACNSLTITSNKQRQEHNNLITIQIGEKEKKKQTNKLKGAHERSKSL